MGTPTTPGSGVPSRTLTTQSPHAGPATWQDSQSITMPARLNRGSDNRSNPAVARALLARAAELRARDHLDAIARRAPAASDGFHFLRHHGALVDLDIAGKVRMPVLAGLHSSHYVEPGQVAAMATPQARGLVGKSERHAREPTVRCQTRGLAFCAMSTAPKPNTPNGRAQLPQHTQLTWDEFAAEEPLSELTFVIVDLETTGGPATQAGITEIGAVKVRGGEILGEFATLVDPGHAIPVNIQSLTGITPTMVRDAPSVAGAVASFGEFARDFVIVAHNAPYDLGFLKAACAKHDLSWFPGRSLDTARLARVALHAGEVRNCKLATLAQHFGSPVTPVHRALADAQATTHVLHRLLERVGSFGVYTWTDLRAFVSRVSQEQRAKRHLADNLPTGPGVYTFVDQQGAALYIGMSRNIRSRVRSYFTSAEQRARMTEMIHIAQRVDAIPCATALEANVRELRAITEQQPRYNRRSRRASTSWWLQLSEDSAPRLVTARAVGDEFPDAGWGPFPSRGAARDAAELICDHTGLRTCTSRLPQNPSTDSPQCLRGHLGSCAAPCSRTGDRIRYVQSVTEVKSILDGRLDEFVHRAHERMKSYANAEQFEDAARLRDHMTSVIAVSERFHRLRTLRNAGRIVAAAPDRGGWDIHVIDDGRLVAATHATPAEDPRACARAAVATAETRGMGTDSTTVEEMSLVARWLESPTVRLVSVDEPLSWPAASGSRAFVAAAQADVVGSSSTSSRHAAQRPVGPAPGVSYVSRLSAGVSD